MAALSTLIPRREMMKHRKIGVLSYIRSKTLRRSRGRGMQSWAIKVPLDQVSYPDLLVNVQRGRVGLISKPSAIVRLMAGLGFKTKRNYAVVCLVDRQVNDD